MPESLEQFLARIPVGMPRARRPEPESGEEGARDGPGQHAARGHGRPAKRKRQSHGQEAESSTSEDDVEPDIEADLDLLDPQSEDVWAELEEIRGKWRALPEVRDNDFGVTVLGGQWTARHRGVAADALKGHARTAEAQSWCRRVGVPVSARFEISAYGQAAAATLARAWCSRMQHFYNLAEEMPEDADFTDEQRGSWQEPSEFRSLLAQQDLSERLRSRGAQIRGLFA
jgi:hypothetical protein